MLKYQLISKKEGFYHYEIYPEGRIEDKETLVFNPTTKEVRQDTFVGYQRIYLGHFLQGFKNSDGSFRESGMVGWG